MANNSNNNNQNMIQDPEQSTNSFIPYTAFNTHLNQGLNPGDYYGVGEGQTCNLQGCVPNVIAQEKYVIPSLEQVAEYNRESLYGNMQNTNTAPNASTQSANKQNAAAVAQSMPQNPDNQGIQSTPATVLDYGATIDSNQLNAMGTGVTDFQNPYPITPESLQYLNGFMRTQIGRRVSIDFLVGSNTIVTKLGYLLGVASNYILINELDTNDITTCDFYNIKFIRFFY